MPDSVQVLKPKGAPPRPVSFCKECTDPYWPTRRDQEFCTSACRMKYHKRRSERGARLYDLAMEWRVQRRPGGFKRFCQLLDDWLRDDRRRAKARDLVRKAWQKQERG